MAGDVTMDDFVNAVDAGGTRLEDVLSSFGIYRENLASLKRDPKTIKAYFELHIEQGPVLESKKKKIGVVTAIAAPSRFRVVFRGQADHSGTTPMEMRKDALVAAGYLITYIDEVCREHAAEDKGRVVGTVGAIKVEPGVINAIPGRTELQVDVRSITASSKRKVAGLIKKRARQIARERGMKVDLLTIRDEEPVALHPGVISLIRAACEEREIPFEVMPSGSWPRRDADGQDHPHRHDLHSQHQRRQPQPHGMDRSRGHLPRHPASGGRPCFEPPMQKSKATKKTQVLSGPQIKRVLAGFAKRISEEYADSGSLAFVGIRTRGPTLARRVAGVLKERHDLPVPVGELDATLYRDDLNTLLPKGRIDATHIPFEVNDKTVILFDDVLQTGRTVRAAVDHLMALGRPRAIFLAVMVDRGGRELPIEARFVGKQVEMSKGGDVRVRLAEIDQVDEVIRV